MFIQCTGEIIQTSSTVLSCSTDWVLTSSPQSFDPATLDPSLIVGAVAFGFFCMTSLFAAIAGVRFLIKTVKYI